jgi:hypothetical protein
LRKSQKNKESNLFAVKVEDCFGMDYVFKGNVKERASGSSGLFLGVLLEFGNETL